MAGGMVLVLDAKGSSIVKGSVCSACPPGSWESDVPLVGVAVPIGAAERRQEAHRPRRLLPGC